MKKLFVLLFIFICVWMTAWAETREFDLIGEYVKIYGNEVDDAINSVSDKDIKKLVPGFNTEEILSGLAKGENIFSLKAVGNAALKLFAGEIRNSLKSLIFIFAMGIFCTYLTNIQSSLEGHGATDTAFFVCYIVISGIGAATFLDVVGCAKETISNLSMFMRTMVPISMATLAASGALISAGTFEVTVVAVIEITQWVLEYVFLPLIMMSVAMSLVNNLSKDLNAEKMVQFMNKTTKWGIGVVMTLFVGVMGLQGIVSGSADGLTLKLTKFAASNLIPLVGGALSETAETVMNCSVVIKNAVGVFGIIAVALIVAVPVVKVSACLILFRLCAAILQMVCDKRIVKCISEFADSISGIFAILAVVAVMFIIILTIIINAGNSVVLLGR
ncbi:MAG: stage III sporulation protein AE [Clostridia bacterium]|nr:stage III sporulation protein AE [Clostridia bacterium]